MSDEHRRGKKKAVRKPEAEADPEFQIAPMIDILLVLLVFFMSISTTEVLQSSKDVRLPIAKDAKEAKKNVGQVIVNVLYSPVSNMTSIEVDEMKMNPNDLVGFLQARVAKAPSTRVLVRADKEVRYQELRNLLEVIGKSNISDVTFSVVDKDES